jgi:hypothetical protein
MALVGGVACPPVGAYSVHPDGVRTRHPPEYTIAAGGTDRLSLSDRSQPEVRFSVHGELKGDSLSHLRSPFVLNQGVLHGIVDAG